MESNGKGCINSDYYGCLNMTKIFNSFMTDGARPQRYCRGYESVKIPIPHQRVKWYSACRRLGYPRECIYIIGIKIPFGVILLYVPRICHNKLNKISIITLYLK